MSAEQGRGSAILAEHKTIRGILSALEATDDVRRAVTILEDLRGRLTAHFLMEEGPGGLEEMVSADAPHLHGRLQGLMDEHPAILEGVDTLSETARAYLDGLAALIEMIRAHEESEVELLSDVVYTDIGGSG